MLCYTTKDINMQSDVGMACQKVCKQGRDYSTKAGSYPYISFTLQLLENLSLQYIVQLVKLCMST